MSAADARHRSALLTGREHDRSTPPAFFRPRFTAEVGSAEDGPHILAYPDPDGRARDEEEESLDLLYREAQTFAVGHGCAADWKQDTMPPTRER